MYNAFQKKHGHLNAFSFVCSHTHFNKCDGKHKFIKYHDYKNLNKDNLQHDLDNASWYTAFESKCVNEVLDSLEKNA